MKNVYVTRLYSNKTSVPKPVREALGLRNGDYLAWVISDDGTVVVKKMEPREAEELRELRSVERMY